MSIQTHRKQAFFCLENDHWRIIGLDTGYNSLKGFLGVRPNELLRLHTVQFEWLKNIVQPSKDNRGIILLAHHQFFSAFDDEYPVPAQQLAELFSPGQTVLWFWGHEHRLALYGKNQLSNGTNVYCRCIGNSGMPVELQENGNDKVPKVNNNPKDIKNRNLVIYDNRLRTTIDGNIRLGHNGYVILKLKENKLTAEYFDDNADNTTGETRKILEESWLLDNSTGKLSAVSIKDHTKDSASKLKLFASDINLAIR